MSDKSKPSDKAVELAACCWCTEQTKTIPMDVRLANAFAAVLDPLLSQVAELEQKNLALWEMLAWWQKLHPNSRVQFQETFTLNTTVTVS